MRRIYCAKIILVLYALHIMNPNKFNKIKLLLIILTLLMIIHLGYQEIIYNKDESPTLNFSKFIVKYDDNPTETIQYTKFFGCGTFIFFLIIIVYNWNDK